MKAALRSRVTYANLTATLALALAMSMGGAYAAGQIGAADIKDDAVRTRHIADGNVTKNDLKDGAVTRAKLAPGAQSQVIEYRLGSHDFTADLSACVDLTGLTRSQIVNSVWTAQLTVLGFDDLVYAVPGHGEGAATQYRVAVESRDDGHAVACVARVAGPGEAYDAVRFIRTVPTEILQGTPF